MFQIIKFQVEHTKNLVAQLAQQAEHQILPDSDERWRLVAKGEYSYSATDSEDNILACGGLIPRWPGVAEVWLLLSMRVDRYGMLFLHRSVNEFLDKAMFAGNFKRLQTTVLESFDPGHRWVQMLGFRAEGLMHYYGPDGSDHQLYARTI